MDPRRIQLNRRHSIEMGRLFDRFCREHPANEFGFGENSPRADRDEQAWTAYSAELLARHQAERSALAEVLEAEQRQTVSVIRREADDIRRRGEDENRPGATEQR
ncbi:hypothetical protein [Nocardia mikamii]|uniref:hypothetical protein n=1 Tax=Nocardia mikamii TaxID=508464 RepID=UPI0007A42438|nr:hypothetical protein [Nocardia mikamii]